MRTELYWVEGSWPGRLAVMPRPRGGDWLEDEVRSWRQAGVDVVLSLLTPDEVADLGLAEEGALCQANGIEFLSLPIPDRGIPPSRQPALLLALRLYEDYLSSGKTVAIHCRQGIGRAGMMAALTVVFDLECRRDVDEAIQRVSAARGCPIPETPEQRRWIEDASRLTYFD
jgi:protein-tyrosine phosphatase